MQKAGRAAWNEDDFAAATDAYLKLAALYAACEAACPDQQSAL